MDLNDLYKLAGIQTNDTPAIKPEPVEQEVTETPFDGRGDMKAMIALISPEQLNQLVGNAPVEEEGFVNSGAEYAGEPEEYKGTLGSPADLSLRRYLGANGQPVKMENVYSDHKVEDIAEAWNAYKLEEAPGDLANILQSFRRDGSANMSAMGPKSMSTMGKKTGPGDRGFTPGVQEPETRLKNQRGFDPMGDQEPETRLKNDRGYDPMGGQEPETRLKNQRGFDPFGGAPGDEGEGDPMGGMGEPGGPADPKPGTRPPGPIGPKPTPTPGEPVPEPREPGEPTPTPGGGPEEPPKRPGGEPVPEPRDPKAPPAPPTPGGGPEEPPAVPGGEPVPGPKPTPPENPSGGPNKPIQDPPMPQPGGGPEEPPKPGEPGGGPDDGTRGGQEPDKAPKAPQITPQMRKDAEEYADREGLPLDQLDYLVPGTVAGFPTTLEVDKFGTVRDMKTGDIISGDEAEAAREAAKGRTRGLGKKSESLERLRTLSGITESDTMMERPSDKSRRGTRPPDAIGPGIIMPKIGEPIPGPRPDPRDPIIGPGAGDPIGEPIPEPRPEPGPPMPTPGGGPEEPPKGFGDPDEGWYIEEPPKPGVNDDPTTKIPQIPMSTKIDPKDIDGDSPDEPDQGKDVFGRDKAALAKKDAIFKKYGLTPPASALFQSADLNEEPNEGNEFTGELAKAKAAGKKEFAVGGKTYKVENVDALSILKRNAGI